MVRICKMGLFMLAIVFIAPLMLQLLHLDFMTDLQSRLHRAKQQWSARLEDFTKKVTSAAIMDQHSDLEVQVVDHPSFKLRMHPFVSCCSYLHTRKSWQTGDLIKHLMSTTGKP